MTSLGQCKGIAFTSQVPVQTPGHGEGLFRNRHCLLNTCDGEDMTNLPPNFPPPPPGGPIYGQHLPPGWENRKESDFWDTFDFSFESYVTPIVVKVVYALTVILGIVGYAAFVLMMFAVFLPDREILYTKVQGSAVPGVLALIFGWLPVARTILSTRVGLERSLALVRTAIDVRALRDRYVGKASHAGT